MKNTLNNLKFITIAFAVIAASATAIGFIYWRASNVPDFSSDKQLFSAAPDGQLFAGDFNSPANYNQPLLIKLADLAISIAPIGALPAQAVADLSFNFGNFIRNYPPFSIPFFLEESEKWKFKT